MSLTSAQDGGPHTFRSFFWPSLRFYRLAFLFLGVCILFCCNRDNNKLSFVVAFRIYDMDNDVFISNGELFQVLKMMVGNNLKDTQLQQIVDKTILFADKDEDGKISFEEFCNVCHHHHCLN